MPIAENKNKENEKLHLLGIKAFLESKNNLVMYSPYSEEGKPAKIKEIIIEHEKLYILVEIPEKGEFTEDDNPSSVEYDGCYEDFEKFMLRYCNVCLMIFNFSSFSLVSASLEKEIHPNLPKSYTGPFGMRDFI